MKHMTIYKLDAMPWRLPLLRVSNTVKKNMPNKCKIRLGAGKRSIQ